MSPFPPALAQGRAEIAALCLRFGVRRLELFGSAARGGFGPGCSDYDVLVDLDPAAGGSRAARIAGLAASLEALLGAPVDLVNPRCSRNPHFAAEVERRSMSDRRR